MKAYIVTAYRESVCKGYTLRKSSSNLAVSSSEEKAKLAVKEIIDRYLSDPEITVHKSGHNFVEYSLKGLEFDKFRYTYEIEVHTLL